MTLKCSVHRYRSFNDATMQCLERFLGSISQNPSISKSSCLHVVIFRIFFINLSYIP